jgi:hypothetical protein
MRECPVCDAIVLLHHDHCTICGHDLALPAPAAEPEPDVATPSLAEPERESDQAHRLPQHDVREKGPSRILGAIAFLAAAALIVWFIGRGGPLDDSTDEVTAEIGTERSDVDEALAICAGALGGVEDAPAYQATPGVHPTAVLVGDLGERDLVTTSAVFPADWLVDISEEPLADSELVLCVSRSSTGGVDSTCAVGFDPDAIVRVDTTYRVRVFETATGRKLVDEPIASAPFEPCPAEDERQPGTVYAEPDAFDLARVAVPRITIG